MRYKLKNKINQENDKKNQNNNKKNEDQIGYKN
jgi:hypothetical protein